MNAIEEAADHLTKAAKLISLGSFSPSDLIESKRLNVVTSHIIEALSELSKTTAMFNAKYSAQAKTRSDAPPMIAGIIPPTLRDELMNASFRLQEAYSKLFGWEASLSEASR